MNLTIFMGISRGNFAADPAERASRACHEQETAIAAISESLKNFCIAV